MTQSNWNSPWGSAEKYAYRQGIKKGEKLAEDRIARQLEAMGERRAARAVATGEVPLDPPEPVSETVRLILESYHRRFLALEARMAELKAAVPEPAPVSSPTARIRDAVMEINREVLGEPDNPRIGGVAFAVLHENGLINDFWWKRVTAR